MTDTKSKILEAQRTPSRINMGKYICTDKPVMFKLQKNQTQRKNLERSQKKKHITYKRI